MHLLVSIKELKRETRTGRLLGTTFTRNKQ